MHAPRQLPVAPSGTLVVAVAGAAAAGLGVLAAIDPVIALVAVLGALATAAIVADLTLGLYVFVGLSFLEALPKLLPVVTVAKALGLLLVLSWLASVAIRGRGVPSLLAGRPALVALLALFVTWVGVSLLWALESGPVVSELTRFLPLFALFPIVYAALRTRRHAVTLVLFVIGGAIVSAAAGILSPPPPDVQGAGRLAGAGVGANALAPVLVCGAVLAAAFAGMQSHPARFRLAAVAAAGFCIVGVVLTGSRGGLFGLGVALAAGLVFAGRGRRAQVVPVVAVATALTILYIATLAPPILRDRIAQPGDGSGRADIWRVGVEMVKANPLLGVGAGNFKARSPEYVLEAGLIRRSDLIVDRPHVTHNIYLQVLSQLGIVGLVLFVSIIGSSLAATVSAARAFARQKDEQMELIARAVFVGLCGMLVAGFFGSWLFSKALWLLLAIGPALLALARHTPNPAGSPSLPDLALDNRATR
jgi:O-antigen ligase